MTDTWNNLTINWVNTGSIILIQPVQATVVQGISYGILLSHFTFNDQLFKIYESQMNSN